MSSSLLAVFLNTIEKGAFPRVQKAVWKWLYHMMASKWRSKNWVFMNYGYLPVDSSTPFDLNINEEHDRCFIGQYHHAVCDVEIEGKRVLEIGSGRGGGASYITRYFKPKQMVGLDYSPSAVELSQHIHKDVDNLTFTEGDAENLPFENNFFDVVVNVESSHCYGNVPAFVAEVERVLKPGGCFTWADFRSPNTRELTEQAFQRPGLKLVHEKDITRNVIKALDDANEQKLNMIAGIPLFKGLFREFSGIKGSMMYNGMTAGDVVYLSKRLIKTSG